MTNRLSDDRGTGGTPRCIAPRRAAFSLIELMIAIVILGLGLVMVATMFPVALSRARQLTDATRQTSINQVVETTVDMLARVDSLTFNGGSFAGDMIFDETKANAALIPPYPGQIVTLSDTRVHYLHMENVQIGPRQFVPSRMDAWADQLAPWVLERVLILSADNPASFDLSNICPTEPYCQQSFLKPQVSFEQRVYPPLRPRDPASYNAAGVFETADPDATWDEMLDTRRYAWAVLHRLRERVGPEPYSPVVHFLPPPPPNQIHPFDKELQAEDAADSPRKLDLYIVTLRRPQATLRYTRQNPDTAPNPYVLSLDPATPVAMPPSYDVVLPEPWRVQIELPNTLTSAAAGTATSIPTEVQAPPEALATDPNNPLPVMLADMFQRGTLLIDEVTGQLYRVTKRRLAANEIGAILTLDREITLEDIDLPPLWPGDPLCPTCQPGILDPEELIRTVWVFPPPALTERLDGADGVIPAFDGPQPVVGIDMRRTTIRPRQ